MNSKSNQEYSLHFVKICRKLNSFPSFYRRSTTCTKGICIGGNANACTYFQDVKTTIKTNAISSNTVSTTTGVKTWTPISGFVRNVFYNKNFNYALALTVTPDANGFLQTYYYTIIRPDGRTKVVANNYESDGSSNQVIPTPMGKYLIIANKKASDNNANTGPGPILLRIVRSCDLVEVLRTSITDATWKGFESLQFMNENTLFIHESVSDATVTSSRVFTWIFNADTKTTTSTVITSSQVTSQCLSVSTTSSQLSRSNDLFKVKGSDGKIGAFYNVPASTSYSLVLSSYDVTTTTQIDQGNYGQAFKPFNCKTEALRTNGAFITSPIEKCTCGSLYGTPTQYNVDCGTFSTSSCSSGDQVVSTAKCGFLWAQTKFVCSHTPLNSLNSCSIVSLSSTAIGFNSDEAPPIVQGVDSGIDGGTIGQVCIGLALVGLVAIGVAIRVVRRHRSLLASQSKFEGIDLNNNTKV